MRIGDPLKLRLYRIQHRTRRVAEAGDRRTARRIEIALAITVDQIRSIAPGNCRQFGFRVAVEDMAHGATFPRCDSRGKVAPQDAGRKRALDAIARQGYMRADDGT